jgi:hypothetical protein
VQLNLKEPAPALDRDDPIADERHARGARGRTAQQQAVRVNAALAQIKKLSRTDTAKRRVRREQVQKSVGGKSSAAHEQLTVDPREVAGTEISACWNSGCGGFRSATAAQNRSASSMAGRLATC